jgi:hypothetical protein
VTQSTNSATTGRATTNRAAGSRRRSVLVAGVVALVVAGGLISGMLVGGSGSPAGDTSAWPSITLASSFVTPAGSWSIVPMGVLQDPLNLFWQIFFRAKGRSQWSLVTPPGVGDNGGLAAAVGPGDVVTIVFDPTNLLKFSPFETTSDNGRTWTVGVIPFGTPTLPDVLIPPETLSGQFTALDEGSSQVEAGTGDQPQWSDVYSESGLSRSAAGRVCGVRTLTTLAGLGSDRLVGSTCSVAGVVGIFRLPSGAESRPSDWQLVGPTVAAADGDFDVLRLSATGDRVAALVDGRNGRGGASNNLYGVWTDGHGPVPESAWSVSAPLHLGAHTRIVSSGFGAGGSLVIETESAGRSLAGWTVSPGAGASWEALPPLPIETQSVSVGVDGTITALSVGQSLLSVWRLQNGSWTKTQSTEVPIQYGSAS